MVFFVFYGTSVSYKRSRIVAFLTIEYLLVCLIYIPQLHVTSSVVYIYKGIIRV